MNGCLSVGEVIGSSRRLLLGTGTASKFFLNE